MSVGDTRENRLAYVVGFEKVEETAAHSRFAFVARLATDGRAEDAREK